jgi:hypothetical protein
VENPLNQCKICGKYHISCEYQDLINYKDHWCIWHASACPHPRCLGRSPPYFTVAHRREWVGVRAASQIWVKSEHGGGFCRIPVRSCHSNLFSMKVPSRQWYFFRVLESVRAVYLNFIEGGRFIYKMRSCQVADHENSGKEREKTPTTLSRHFLALRLHLLCSAAWACCILYSLVSRAAKLNGLRCLHPSAKTHT